MRKRGIVEFAIGGRGLTGLLDDINPQRSAIVIVVATDRTPTRMGELSERSATGGIIDLPVSDDHDLKAPRRESESGRAGGNGHILEIYNS
ncbi:MAG: hypothetical protein IVW56_03000 [Candidatus Binataceae bacterium]|nr:hypothetical protein [Candidatus Binataceae bacterium]